MRGGRFETEAANLSHCMVREKLHTATSARSCTLEAISTELPNMHCNVNFGVTARTGSQSLKPDTLTDVHLVVGLRVTDALELKLLQGLRELLDGHREICGSEREPASVESRTEPVEAHTPPSCTPGQDYKQTTAK